MAKQEPIEEGRVYGGQSMQARAERRRQQFLEAGLQVFGTTGYRSATVRMLCNEAKLTDRYFYESFKNTEDLLMAVYRQCCDKLQVTVLKAVIGSADKRQLADTIRVTLNALFTEVSDPRVARVCWLEILGVNPKIDAMYQDMINVFATFVLGLTRHFVPSWKPDEKEAHILGIAMIGSVSQAVTYWVLQDYKESKATLVAATSRIFIGLVATLTAE